MLVAEHTWGKDIKKFFHNSQDYSVAQMEKLVGTPEYCDVAKSWEEQREYVYRVITEFVNTVLNQQYTESNNYKMNR